MSYTHMGGYFYFSDVDMLDIAKRFLIALRSPEDEMDWTTIRGMPPPTIDAAIAEFPARFQRDEAWFRLDWVGYHEGLLTFSEANVQDGIQTARLTFPFREMVDRDQRALPLFIRCWERVCDAVKPQFGYFEASEFGVWDSTRERTLEYLQEGNPAHLLIDPHFWLAYVAAPTAQRWKEALMPRFGAEQRPVWLADGALFLESFGDLQYLSDRPLDHGNFLVKYLDRKYPEGVAAIPGMQIIYDRLKAIMDADVAFHNMIHEAVLDFNYGLIAELPKSFPPQPNYEEELDDIHTLLATAFRQPELTAVRQTVSWAGLLGQEERLIVPIIADGGKRWVIYTESMPAASDDPLWNDPDTGMVQRLNRLLAATQHREIGGTAPHVHVVFWQGVGATVQSELIAMGITFEIPDTLPLLDWADD